ncbi:3-oxoadipate enol-lactonase [Dongia deserti]|uniref:3-oxoadipate enol-lactonase n=1 Tax=Dongia deserti TaxID=2268030 RepID=UPI002546D0B5|nr:3-oxoadipate enol-lactonase [Dongia deserti]
MLHFRDENPRQERTFVFVNSLGTDLRIWDDVVAYFGADFRTLRYDLRGHGLSDAPPAPYSIEDHVADLAALLDAHQIKNAVVIGLSVGGMVAQALASQRVDLVRMLVLCDTAHKVGTAEMWNARIDAVRKDGLASIADAVLERWFSSAFRQTRPADLAGYRNMLTRAPAEGYVGTCATLRDTDLTAASAQITQPALCLVGEEDTATPSDLVRSLSELMPNAAFETIAGAGHLPCVEQPKPLALRIESFVRRNWSA